MFVKINALNGQLKLNPKLCAIAKHKKKDNKGEKKDKKKKNKKDTSNRSIVPTEGQGMEEGTTQRQQPQGKASGQIYLPVVRAPHGMDSPQASGMHS
jgi:hypothetical protein